MRDEFWRESLCIVYDRLGARGRLGHWLPVYLDLILFSVEFWGT